MAATSDQRKPSLLVFGAPADRVIELEKSFLVEGCVPGVFPSNTEAFAGMVVFIGVEGSPFPARRVFFPGHVDQLRTLQDTVRLFVSQGKEVVLVKGSEPPWPLSTVLDDSVSWKADIANIGPWAQHGVLGFLLEEALAHDSK